MPVCPGCERRVSHEQLPIHQRCCEALYGSGGSGTPVAQRVEECLTELNERLEKELEEREEEMDRRLHRLEDELRTK